MMPNGYGATAPISASISGSGAPRIGQNSANTTESMRVSGVPVTASGTAKFLWLGDAKILRRSAPRTSSGTRFTEKLGIAATKRSGAGKRESGIAKRELLSLSSIGHASDAIG